MFKILQKSILILCFWSLVPGPWSLVLSSPKDPNYPLSNAFLISKTLTQIQKHYFDPKRIDPLAMFEASLKEIQKTVPEILAKCERPKFCSITVKQAIKRFDYPEENLDSLKVRFKEIFDFFDHHVDRDTEKREIEYAAINGMLNELDPHSNFLPPDAYREFRVGTEGEFGGLGIVIGIKEGQLTVTAPLEGTPAWKAGIKAGDHILQIDDESTINMSLTEAVSKLRGRVGTKVMLKIERPLRKEPFFATLTRAVINIEAVQSKLTKTPQGNPVGFIRVKSFQANTKREVLEHLNRLTQTNALKGVILDLRDNPGGLLDQSIFLADIFLKEGVIVSTVGRDLKRLDLKEAGDDGFEGAWPLIVLVNEGSASASEIVAGALKNNDRALILGTKTFGKGSVQSIFELPYEAAVKITVGEYLTPGDRSIQSVGITPDIELSQVVVDKEHLDTIENIQMTEKDLEKHLQRESLEIEKPSFRLRFFKTAPKEEEKVEYSTELNLKEDTWAMLAVDLMDSLKAPSRPLMLQEAQTFLQKRQSEEEQKIAQGFQKLGVDWELKKSQGTPQAELTYHLLKDGKEISKAKAGDTVNLKIQIKNVGDGPFFRLAAQTDSKSFWFKNIEFAFGEIDPGQSRVWEGKFKIPPMYLTEEENLDLKFEEGNGKIPPPVSIILPIQGLERPYFTHSYALEENAFEALKEGKSVNLTVEVANQGNGVSKKPLVTIKNLRGKEIFIEKGRIALDTLSPGQKAKASFRFHIEPEAKDKAIEVELSILDSDLLIKSEQRLEFKMKEGRMDPPQKKWYQPPKIILAKALEKASEIPFLLEGRAMDDQTIRDVYIFVEDEKTYYEASVTQDPKLNFKTMLPLKEGNNTVLITARDNDNLVSSEWRVIRFEPPKRGQKL